jgi:hypothetical protein
VKGLASISANIFLKKIKETVGSRSFSYYPRTESDATLLSLGMTQREVAEVVLGLSTEDYCSGPDPDRDRPGEIYVFGKTINEKQVYIKLKVFEVNGVLYGKCFGFHFARHPLVFPCKC